MSYKSAAALEMAVKATASASPMDTGRAVSAFYFHRLLYRVFANGNDSFVLKGGQAMLARTMSSALSACSSFPLTLSLTRCSLKKRSALRPRTESRSKGCEPVTI